MTTAPRQLAEDDDLSGFHSGADLIDTWLEKRAHRARKQGTAVTYVSFGENNQVAGFYSLSAGAIIRERVQGGWLPRNSPEQIPVVLLGMLAVDTAYQGRGIGWQLLHDAVTRSLSAATQIGVRALVVDPLDSKVASFYEKCGFLHLAGSERMFFKLA